MIGYANSEKYVIIKKIHNLVCRKVRLGDCHIGLFGSRGNIMGKPKGLQGYRQEDASLGKKVTYEQFASKELTSNNRDYKIEDAYRAYRKVIEQMKV